MKNFQKIIINEIENREWYANFWRIRLLGVILFLFLPIAILMDIFWSFNNYIVFKIANIDSLKRSDYINIWSRIRIPNKSLYYRLGCVYCAYVNGMANFGKDICLSYELLFCPWKNKNAKQVKHYQNFKEW